MVPTLAMYNTVFGPASTLLAFGIGVFWIWAIARRYPLNQPLIRIYGVVALAFSLSITLGFNQTHDPRFDAGGGFGGQIGRWFADRILAFNIPFLTGLVIFLLVISVLASLILATEWMLIPLHFRRQQTQFASAGMDGGIFGLGNLPTAMSRSSSASATATAPAAEAEDDSTVDPLGGGPATATLDREEVMPSAYRPTKLGVMAGGGEAEVMPLNEGATLAPDEADPANMPWYMRRRARRDAERAEREARGDADAALGPEPDVAAEFDVSPRAHRRREEDSAENEAATADLTDDLTESVGANLSVEALTIPEVANATLAPPAESETVSETASEATAALEAIFAEPSRENVTEAAAPPVAMEPETAPQSAAPEVESRGDSFADLFGAAESALEVPPPAPEVVAPEPPPVAEAASYVEPERTIEPTEDTAAVEPVVEQAAPARPAPIDDPEQLLFLTAGDAVVSGQRASISFLQRTLSIGYFQAAKLLDRLEREGVIGPYTGAVSRNVVMSPADWTKKKA